MCVMCEDGADVTIMTRHAQRLLGLRWEGSHAQAATGALHPLNAEMRRRSSARRTMWKTPVVALSWNDRQDGLRYFVGIEPEPGEDLGDDLTAVELPSISYATAWHGPDAGTVPAHYGRMLEWVRLHGRTWWPNTHHHREEYPPHAGSSADGGLRLMLPLAHPQD
jgi:predicted transcriptional regulator YdeE